MTAEITSKDEKEKDQIEFLRTLVLSIVEEEKFDFEELSPTFTKYYKTLNPTNGDRCVDGRPVVEKVGSDMTGHKGEDYLGVQIPGGTLGELDVLKKITGTNEKKARSVIKNTYSKNGLRMAGHTDDKHGEIKTLPNLRQRKKGCGDQGAKTDGLLPMYEDQEFEENLLSERLDWIIENNGDVFPLSGGHEEKLAAINLKENSTFDTTEASKNSESIFSCDVAEIYKRSSLIYNEITRNEESKIEVGSKEDFQKDFTREVVRNYFQTLVALKQPPHVFIRG